MSMSYRDFMRLEQRKDNLEREKRKLKRMKKRRKVDRRYEDRIAIEELQIMARNRDIAKYGLK